MLIFFFFSGNYLPRRNACRPASWSGLGLEVALLYGSRSVCSTMVTRSVMEDVEDLRALRTMTRRQWLGSDLVALVLYGSMSVYSTRDLTTL